MSGEDEFLSLLRDWMETSTHRSIHAFIRHNRESKLSLSQVNTLIRLYHHGPSSVNDLAHHLGITKAAVSQLLDQLVKTGYVLRSTNPEDRRVKLMALTAEGVDTVEKSMHARHAWIEDLGLSFTTSEIAQLIPALVLLNNRTRALLGDNDHQVFHRVESTSNDTETKH